MVKLAFITLTNYGYLDYTKNLIKSLEKLNVEGLKVYCLDNKSFNELDYPDKFKIENTEEEEIEDFYTFRSGNEWSLIMYNKFRIIHKELLNNDFVLFCDGDIIFRDRRFMRDLLNRIDDHDLLIQSDKQDDSDDSELCAGFQFIKSNNKTKEFYKPSNEKMNEILHLKCDQPFINKHKNKLDYERLPLKKYPNGLYFQTHKNYSYMIHYNYLIGHTKKDMMIQDNHWFI